MKKIIKIDGMGCQKCVAHVKEALENLDGVDLLEVNWRSICGYSRRI